jgi:hypothetical protein
VVKLLWQSSPAILNDPLVVTILIETMELLHVQGNKSNI